MPSVFRRLRERKLVQWALVYLAAAWLAFQAVEVLAEPWNLPAALQRSIHLILVVGFFITLVVAWYHGEKGRQRVSGPELLMIAALCAIGAGVLAFVGSQARTGPEVASASLLAVDRDRPAVAVLPFANLSAGEEDRYFVDGFHEDVLNQLAKIASIDVLARQAVLRYRDSEKGPREIGTELSATTILEGSVRREADHIRITVQLIDAANEAHLWSEQYDETLSGASVFSIQSRIAQQVARAIGAVLSPEEESRIQYPETQSLTAYDLYVTAQALSSRSEEERIRLIRLALEDDPEFAPAWAELGMQYGFNVWYRGWNIAWADSALAAARRAVALAPDQPDGYRALAYAYAELGMFRAMEEASRKIVELAPSDAFGIRALAWALESFGQLPEAVEWNRRAIALHPYEVVTRANLATLYCSLGLVEKAEEQLEVVAILSPRAALALSSVIELARGNARRALALREEHLELGEHPTIDDVSYRRASKLAAIVGDYEKALSFAQEAARRSGFAAVNPDPFTNSAKTALGSALLRTGTEQEGRRLLGENVEELEERVAQSRAGPNHLWELAATYAALGRTPDALEWARKALEAGFRTNPRYVELDPLFESLRGDPEFERIIARIRADHQVMARRVLDHEAQEAPR
ncbi:MAG: hypothetical protein JSW71_05505 [Gemmatimonadota bacterium]|nr:MAG: hypothetical protein JSW71_05505 [Gemmatimonadota bacterium]